VFAAGLMVFFGGDLMAALAIFITLNFALELVINILCAPVLFRILHAIEKR
jgi:hypothetical protein